MNTDNINNAKVKDTEVDTKANCLDYQRSLNSLHDMPI